MQTLENVNKIISLIQYKDWKFVVLTKGDGFLIQVQFMGEDTDGSGQMELQKCRKWFISQHSGDSEIIRSCFLAIRQAEEHELCERFLYKGQQIYNPHLDMDRMADFITAKPFEVRPQNLLTDDNPNPINWDINYLHKNGSISSRLLGVLRRAHVQTIEEAFKRHSVVEFSRVRQCGKMSLQEMKEFGQNHNLKFKE